jgi:hypothetical protein
MKLYINNLIPRLKQFSENLDKKEIFLEFPWVIVDNNLNQQKYIFKRDGDLIMSLNGQVTIGKWEYLSAARSLLIDRIQDKILLNQNFIDPAVMILKKDGFKDENLILANEFLLPDLNVTDYLTKLFYQKNNITACQLMTGEFLEINNWEGWINFNKVTMEGEPVPDGFVQLAQSKKKYVIKDSKVVKVLVKYSYETNKGIIVVEHQEFQSPSKGDFVFQNKIAAPDGKYRLGFLWHITVDNGRIKKT